MARTSSKFLTRRPADLTDVELFQGRTTEVSSVRHLHEDFRFGLALEGQWQTRYRGINLVIGPGQIQLAQPGEISSCEFGPGEMRSFLGISVAANQVIDLTASIFGSGDAVPSFREHVINSSPASIYFLNIHQRLMKPSSALESAWLLQSLIVYFVSSFARHEIPDARSGALRYVKIACDYLQENLSANPTIEELAAIAGLSPFHLSREFRRHMGLPPHAYQIHCRIRKAKALLAENRSGYDVAYFLGFADQSHFIRHFKKQVGMTPEAFRKSVRF